MSKRARMIRRKRSTWSRPVLVVGPDLAEDDFFQIYNPRAKRWQVMDGAGAVIKFKRGGPYRDIRRAVKA